MNTFEINAEPRADMGKGASRRLRRMNKVPGILYGSRKDAVPIALDHDDLSHHLEHEGFYSHILTLNLGGEKQKVVLKDLQRHPFKPRIAHIDLQREKISQIPDGHAQSSPGLHERFPWQRANLVCGARRLGIV